MCQYKTVTLFQKKIAFKCNIRQNLSPYVFKYVLSGISGVFLVILVFLVIKGTGFFLVGSAAGQRHWSSMLNLDNTSITCGVSSDDQKVLFGTTDGQIIVMSSTGAMVSQVTILQGMEITNYTALVV